MKSLQTVDRYRARLFPERGQCEGIGIKWGSKVAEIRSHGVNTLSRSLEE